MPRGAENVRSWEQTGSGRPTLKTVLLTHDGCGGTDIPATTPSFNMVASIRGTVAIQDNRPRDEAIKKPEAAGMDAHIEAVTICVQRGYQS